MAQRNVAPKDTARITGELRKERDTGPGEIAARCQTFAGVHRCRVGAKTIRNSNFGYPIPDLGGSYRQADMDGKRVMLHAASSFISTPIMTSQSASAGLRR